MREPFTFRQSLRMWDRPRTRLRVKPYPNLPDREFNREVGCKWKLRRKYGLRRKGIRFTPVWRGGRRCMYCLRFSVARHNT